MARSTSARDRSPLPAASAVDSVLRGGGEMGALMRSIDWSRTSVGPVESWPQSLRTALSILLETGFPMYIAWGPDYTQFYNDGYRPILGSTKHPAAMGISTRETFSEIWDIIGPMFDGVMEGTPTTVVDFMLPLDRHGFVEECYFVYSYSPIRQEDGTVGGVLVTVTETTQRVIGERRLRTSQALAARTREANTADEACLIAAEVLAENPLDVPFALIYLLDADAGTATLAGAAGLRAGAAAPPRVDLDAEDGPWPLRAAIEARRRVSVESMPHGLTLPPDAPEPERAEVLPIVEQGADTALGVVVMAASPRLILDDDYRRFQSLVASQIGTAITSARAFAEAQARAEALIELDRAKTAFFSNVSHEFRTPLTLMLGPTEEAMASPDQALRGEDLATVHRNELRLLKLVNTLLDFSRIEAGRSNAAFEPTDLSALTVDLASAFRSAIERAGLTLVVDCEPLPEPIYVDRGMWEKIVLNLLSNALKFTFEGRIEVRVTATPSGAELEVADTGVGIPGNELPHVFDRFHRVANVRSRTHEGSGIGLSLVQELVGMHGGSIGVESTPGEGTSFRVSLPAGRSHLPAELISSPKATTAPDAAAFVAEALRWLPSSADGEPPAAAPEEGGVRILVADDNADMRDYVARLLGERWTVETVPDGVAAWEAICRRPPDLLLTDVMMPGLDGFELLQRLRSDDRTRAVPVIVLSARAGEESRVEGLDAGADDYLVKPFSAREIIARVQAQLVRSKVRSIEETHAQRLTSVFEQAPVAVALLRGPEHVFELANARYQSLTGGRELIGRSVREAFPELDRQGFIRLLDEVYQTGEAYEGRSVRVELELDGSRIEKFFDFVYQPLHDEPGEVRGIAVVGFDVTDLVRARSEAERASRAKDEFLAMLGHELRNPLAPILTALELMRLNQPTVAEREREVIERQARHLVGLVDDLLDVSRIARGQVELKRERLDLNELVADAVEMTSPIVDQRRHVLAVDIPAGLTVDGDSKRLGQVMTNLLANAAKYTEPGGTIEVRASEADGSTIITVSDSGIGIAREELPRIFEPFVQERQELDRSLGGLGLGLAIVRSLVQAHGGTVSAESDGPGRGSTFTVRLPTASAGTPRTGAASPPSAEPSRAGGLALLVVDDNRDAAELLAEALAAFGHTVATAHDGPAALELLERSVPDAAVIDIGLPVMDGFELAARLRDHPRGSEVALVALTGYGPGAYQPHSDTARFDAHLVKPVDIAVIDEVIRKACSSRREGRS